MVTKMFEFGGQSWGNKVKCSAEWFDYEYFKYTVS